MPVLSFADPLTENECSVSCLSTSRIAVCLSAAMLQATLTLTALLSTVLTIILVSLPSQYGANKLSKSPTRSTEKRKQAPAGVTIVVLGDIGRSPRMQYHALSIAKHAGTVQLVGYLDSEPHPDILRSSHIVIVPLHNPPRAWQTSNKILFLILGPLKVLFQIWSLWTVLGYRTQPARWTLIQNPPSIPTLLIAQVLCFLRNSKLIIDWHNFGYTILALKLGDEHLLVKASRWYEEYFSQWATAHFAVTNAMATRLKDNMQIEGAVLPLHDRPAPHFSPVGANGRSACLAGIPETAEEADAIRQGKTRLLVSSTSWTPDEDFSILLDALCDYSAKAISTHPQLPEILAIITGKGPQKDYYLRKIEELKQQDKLEMVTIKTAWLSVPQYASLLAAADLGISLHTSSSGVDLPMKVVDMFGAGLPVAGWSRFEAWPELVTEGKNGRGFGSAAGLMDILVELFGGDSTQLTQLKEGALIESRRTWDQEWDSVAGKLLGLTS